MEATVNSALEAITDQLFVNAEKICTYNYEKWGTDLSITYGFIFPKSANREEVYHCYYSV